MHIRISGFSAVYWTLVQRLHHQCELGGDISMVRWRVGLLRRMLPVKFQHKTSKLSHVNMISQFDIYFTSVKVFLKKKGSKLNQNFKHSSPLGTWRSHSKRTTSQMLEFCNKIQFKIFCISTLSQNLTRTEKQAMYL
jgi:hypothetical protein